MWWSLLLSARAEVPSSRGPAFQLAPAGVAAGARLPLGGALSLDLRAGATLQRARLEGEAVYQLTPPVTESEKSSWLDLGLEAVAVPRARLGRTEVVTGWWLLELGGGPAWSWSRFEQVVQSLPGQQDPQEAVTYSGRSVHLRAGTGPGLELDISRRWTMGLDLVLGLARYTVSHRSAPEPRSNLLGTFDETTLDLGLPVDVSFEFLLTRYREAREP